MVKGWEVADIAQPEYARLATEWFESMLAKTAAEVADLFGKYRFERSTDGCIQIILGRISQAGIWK